jgi:hypothetical protein
VGADLPTRLQHWRNLARQYQRLAINGFGLIVVGLCVVTLIEMLWITTPIVFGTVAPWLRALPLVF